MDLYAKASAAAWQTQDDSLATQPPGAEAGINPRPTITHTHTSQTQLVPRLGPVGPSLAAQPAAPARPGITMSHLLPRLTLPHAPFTPPDQQQQQPLQSNSSHLNSRSTGGSHPTDQSGVGNATARLQSATKFDSRSSNMTGSRADAMQHAGRSMPPPPMTAGHGGQAQHSAQQSHGHMLCSSQLPPRTSR